MIIFQSSIYITKSTKFDEPKAFFLTRTIKTNARTCRHNNGVNFDHLSSCLFQSQKGTRDFEGRLWDEFSLWAFPFVETLRSDGRKKKDWSFSPAELFRVFGLFLAPCFGYLFVKTSSAPHSCNTLIKAWGQRERDASVCCCSYQ